MLTTVRLTIRHSTLIDTTTLLGDPYLLADTELNSVFTAVTKYIRDSGRF